MFKPLIIACDFDGTVTAQDTLVEILNTYGNPHWHEIQERVVRGELSIREGLEREMGLVHASQAQLRELLTCQVQIENSFPPFLEEMRRKGIPVILLTGGFDLCVETVLEKSGLSGVPILANRLTCSNGSWAVEFPFPSLHCQTCGHCKADPIRSWNRQGYTTVFVGNGVTDRCSAKEASLTFAKSELADWCQSQNLPWVGFSTFEDVQSELTQRGWL